MCSRYFLITILFVVQNAGYADTFHGLSLSLARVAANNRDVITAKRAADKAGADRLTAGQTPPSQFHRLIRTGLDIQELPQPMIFPQIPKPNSQFLRKLSRA